MSFLWVFLGGGLGSVCRYGVARLLAGQHLSFPWATFAANLLACMLLGLLVALNARGMLRPNIQYMLMTGFCGGFSTFSTFSYESYVLIQNGQLNYALGNILLSCLLGLLAVYLGLKLGGL